MLHHNSPHAKQTMICSSSHTHETALYILHLGVNLSKHIEIFFDAFKMTPRDTTSRPCAKLPVERHKSITYTFAINSLIASFDIVLKFWSFNVMTGGFFFGEKHSNDLTGARRIPAGKMKWQKEAGGISISTMAFSRGRSPGIQLTECFQNYIKFGQSELFVCHTITVLNHTQNHSHPRNQVHRKWAQCSSGKPYLFSAIFWVFHEWSRGREWIVK